MMPMMPTSGDAAKGSSRYAVPSGLVDEKELEEIDNLGPVIGGKEMHAPDGTVPRPR